MREKENRAAARVSLTGARRRAQWKNPEVGGLRANEREELVAGLVAGAQRRRA